MTCRFPWLVCLSAGLIPLGLIISSRPAAAQSATGPLPPLAPAAPILPPTFWEQHGVATLIATFALLGVIAIVLWFILRPRPAVAAPPEVIARATLTRLGTRSEDGQTLSEISRALRRYLIAILNLPPQELTTAEFSNALSRSQIMGHDQAQTVLTFFRECDQRKFSPAATDAAARLNAADRALAIVAQCEQQRAPRPA